MGSEMDNVVKAAKVVCEDAERGAKGVVSVFGEKQAMIDAHFVDTLRTALAAHEAAPTVAVPVEVLREIKEQTNRVNGAATIVRIIDALLPPREPPRELVAEWEREAVEYAEKQCRGHYTVTHEENEWMKKAWVAACRARWAADPKNGGA